jgi:hypothetical protein
VILLRGGCLAAAPLLWAAPALAQPAGDDAWHFEVYP